MPRITFVDSNGVRRDIDAKPGMTILEIARGGNIDIEGACEGSLSCSTCHVIVEPRYYARLPAANDDEKDMLDLAFGVTRTSRLGCQVRVTEELDGLTVRIPSRFQ